MSSQTLVCVFEFNKEGVEDSFINRVKDVLN